MQLKDAAAACRGRRFDPVLPQLVPRWPQPVPMADADRPRASDTVPMRLAAKLVCVLLAGRAPAPALEADAEAVLAWARAKRPSVLLGYVSFLALVLVPPLITAFNAARWSVGYVLVGVLIPHLLLWFGLFVACSPFVGLTPATALRVDEVKAFSLRTLAWQWGVSIGFLIAGGLVGLFAKWSDSALGRAIELWLADLSVWLGFVFREDWVWMLIGVLLIDQLFARPIRKLREAAAEQSQRALAAEAQAQALARSRAEAELRLLQGQIEPHFLYNTLANLRYLIQTQSPDALRMIDALIEYLQSSVPALRAGEVPLARELRHVEHYLRLMQLRMPGRLQYCIEVPARLHEEPVPPLSVLTRVENAIKRGIAPRVEGGTVAVEARELPQGLLQLEVADDGGGVVATSASDCGGTGLANLRERIRLAYGERASLALAQRLPHGTRAILTLPVDRSAAAPADPAAAEEIVHA
ncbi:MAG: sensor histidine kinase [Betaproteobacteria bacterium]